MDHSPPFDPPYATVRQSADGIRVTESLADGTTRDITSTAQGRSLINLLQINKSAASGGEAMNQARQPASSARTVPGNARPLLFLSVPFAEKDRAKALGAKWDAATKKWYVPHGSDSKLFESWWPDALKQK
jgi:hypothetical protein